jgi:hypothetical protein
MSVELVTDQKPRPHQTPKMQASRDLHIFGNAIREYLGLDPLYEDGRWVRGQHAVKK